MGAAAGAGGGGGGAAARGAERGGEAADPRRGIFTLFSSEMNKESQVSFENVLILTVSVESRFGLNELDRLVSLVKMAEALSSYY